jgi:hypothetical protein
MSDLHLKLQKAYRARDIAWGGLAVWMVSPVLLYFDHNWAALAVSLLSGCFSLVSIAISKGWIE